MGGLRLKHALVPILLVLSLSLPFVPVSSAVVEAEAPTRYLVRFDGEVPGALNAGALPGVTLLYAFGSTPAALVEATPAGLAALARAGPLRSIEGDLPLGFDLDSSTTAIRSRPLWDEDAAPSAVLRDASGAVIDGTGVGVAVVDTGFDGTHPDLAAKFGKHFLVTPEGLVEAKYTAQGGGHGTHVAGIVAGSGSASPGRAQAGVAPGATLYGFAVGVTGGISFPAIAFDWILQNGAAQSPPIRVVTNSWNCRTPDCQTWSPDRLHNELATRLAESGVVVVWSAGNRGGNGVDARTNPEATNPTPGVIGVANYNDQNVGVRTGCVISSSSRGLAEAPATWPDVAAPGRTIRSAWPVFADQDTRVPGVERNAYREMTGTSAAAPHVAGIAALLLQANPALTAGEVEYLVKQTATPLNCGVAHPRADPAHPWNGANYVNGHGLVDAYAAVENALAFAGIPAAPALEPLPAGFHPLPKAFQVAEKLYLREAGRMSLDRPTADEPTVTVTAESVPVVFVSDPLPASVTFDSFEVDTWAAFLHELHATRLVFAHVLTTLEQVGPDGAVSLIYSYEHDSELTTPGVPVPRELVRFMPAAVTLSPGDRLRLTLTSETNPSSATQEKVPGAGTWALYSDSPSTPSRVELGMRLPYTLPGSPEECQSRGLECARLDEDRPAAMLDCAPTNTMHFRVAWTGPGGSGVILQCSGAFATCSIPDDVAWGSCESATLVMGVLRNSAANCRSHVPEGAPPGTGRCEWWQDGSLS